MDGRHWKEYFESNEARAPLDCGHIPETELSPELRAALTHAIASFQLGEAAGGRLARLIYGIADPALDGDSRRSIELYVREEGRHAAELASILRALGGRPLSAHWSNTLFTRCRRLLGLRTKLVTMAVAEVVGIVFYGLIRDRAGSPNIARVLGVIAREESRHLDFQSHWFAGALRRIDRRWRVPYTAWLAAQFTFTLGAAITTVLVDQRNLFRLLGVPPRAFVRACFEQALPWLHAALGARSLESNSVRTHTLGVSRPEPSPAQRGACSVDRAPRVRLGPRGLGAA